MRIVAGTAKGRPLRVPSAGTRPTSARARAAVFSRLETLMEIRGCLVLDLFAGSGALGFEAISRGAARAWFVESDRRAGALLAMNQRVVVPEPHRADAVRLVLSPVRTFLASGPPPQPFDLVFADPPYAFAETEVAALLASLADERWTAANAIVVLERSARGPAPEWPDRFDPLPGKRYGEAAFWYGRAR